LQENPSKFEKRQAGFSGAAREALTAGTEDMEQIDSNALVIARAKPVAIQTAFPLALPFQKTEPLYGLPWGFAPKNDEKHSGFQSTVAALVRENASIGKSLRVRVIESRIAERLEHKVLEEMLGNEFQLHLVGFQVETDPGYAGYLPEFLDDFATLVAACNAVQLDGACCHFISFSLKLQENLPN
jgi:hypothetical protein